MRTRCRSTCRSQFTDTVGVAYSILTVTLREMYSSGLRTICEYSAPSPPAARVSGTPSVRITMLSGASVRPWRLTNVATRSKKTLKSV